MEIRTCICMKHANLFVLCMLQVFLVTCVAVCEVVSAVIAIVVSAIPLNIVMYVHVYSCNMVHL